MEGSILLHRKLLDSAVFANPIALKIWVWCLCKASYKKRFVPLKIGKGETIVELQKGQFIYGRNKAEIELNIKNETVRYWIEQFAKKFNMILIAPTNNYSIITICNWELYQATKNNDIPTYNQPITNQTPSNNQPITNEQPSINQATTTNNTVNKDNNVSNVNNVNTVNNTIHEKPAKAEVAPKNNLRDFLIEKSELFKNDDVFEAWQAYEEMRKAKKNKMTDRMRSLAVKNLLEVAKNGDCALTVKIIEKSAQSGYPQFYEPKQNANQLFTKNIATEPKPVAKIIGW